MKKIADRLFSWATLLEDVTLEQARRTATMPFIHPHVALMPDAHLGLGATVGSVIPTLGAVMPAAVGVDIGCGMIAVRTQLVRADLEARGDLEGLRQRIELAVPLSAGARNGGVEPTAAPRVAELQALASEAAFDPAAHGREWDRQLGTLGSGNHPSRTAGTPHSRRAGTGSRGPSARSPSTRRTWSGCSCTPAAAAWATGSRRRTSRSRRR